MTIGLTSGGDSTGTAGGPTTAAPPSVDLTRTYPSLVVRTDTESERERQAASAVGDAWIKAMNERDTEGLRATMCRANADLDVDRLTAQIVEGSMAGVGVSVSGDRGTLQFTFETDDGQKRSGGVPMVKEQDWKVCLQTG